MNRYQYVNQYMKFNHMKFIYSQSQRRHGRGKDRGPNRTDPGFALYKLAFAIPHRIAIPFCIVFMNHRRGTDPEGQLCMPNAFNLIVNSLAFSQITPRTSQSARGACALPSKTPIIVAVPYVRVCNSHITDTPRRRRFFGLQQQRLGGASCVI